MEPMPSPGPPRVVRLAWGRVEVEGATDPLKDAKLFPGGCREWDWNETGTRHSPGIQPGDVEELVARGAEVVVLSNGMLNRLRVCPETLRALEARKVEVHVLQTQAAVRLYNSLCEARRAAALIHSTC